jgi:hypothetical protein
MRRYAANLLFEYGVAGRRTARPLCEKRFVVFSASGPRNAVRRAKQRGKRGEYSYRNAEGDKVQIAFVGLIDVISLNPCEDDEAYYSLRRMSNPKSHVRPDERLSVLLESSVDSKPIGANWWAVPRALVVPPRSLSQRRRASNKRRR